MQGWLDAPASNWGWILVGNEDGTSTAVRFHSKEATTASNRPMLEITFVPEPARGALTAALALFVLRGVRARPRRWNQREKYLT